MRYIELLGRVLFSTIFISSAFGLFTHNQIALAVERGVPMASVVVPFAGLVALSGGLSVLLGCQTKLGAGLVALFLVPVTLTMHNYWAAQDVLVRQAQQVQFFKNLAMLGGAFVISYFGAGPLSIDAGRRGPKRPDVQFLDEADLAEMDSAGYPVGTKRAA